MNKKILIISIIIPLFVGGISSYLTYHQLALYQKLNLPPLAPPGQLFSIIWTILFVLMGISSYYIYVSHHPKKETALLIYAFQLFINFCWPLFFFNLHNYFMAFMILIVLLILIITMMYIFYQIKPLSCYLNILYLLWVCFALYLNFFIFINN
ncbi:MAG: TspO/MBR family protein [Faecalibacillus sp.]